MGQHHLAAARRGRHLNPAGFLEPDRERREALQRSSGIPGFACFGELFDACDPECAIVTAPDRHHGELADACRGRGIPTLVEKPLCPEPAAARRIAASFDKSGIHLAVGAIERFNPSWRSFAQTFLERDDLSAIRIVRRGGDPRDPSSGVAFDLAVHDLDLLCTWLSPRTLPPPLRVENRGNSVAAMFRIGTLVIDLVASWEETVPERTWRAFCGAGTGFVDLARRTASWIGSSGDVLPLTVPDDDPLELEHAAFAAMIRGATPPDHAGIAPHIQALDMCQILSDAALPISSGGSGV